MQEDLKSKKINLTAGIEQQPPTVPAIIDRSRPLSKIKRVFSQGINQYLQPSRAGLKIIFLSLTISYITTFLFCLLIMRIEGFHLEWSNSGQVSHWIRCAFLHSRDGFSGAVIACILTCSTRSIFQKKASFFLFFVLVGIFVSAMAPTIYMLPGTLKQISRIPESWFILVSLQNLWCSYTRPGLVAGVTFFLSLILLAYRQVRLKDSG